MKLNLKSIAVAAAFAATTFTAFADTAGLYDLVVGFKSASATNDVMIDLGNVANYSAPGTYVIGNYNSILSANFGGASWNTSSTLLWGAAATFKDPAFVLPTANYITSKWTTTSGALGASGNSTVWGVQGTGLPTANTSIGKAYNGINSLASSGGTGYTVGVAETIATSNLSSWKAATTTTAAAFQVYSAAQFNNTMANIANSSYSASDLYNVGNTAIPSVTELVGTFAVWQNGDLTFTVAAIPEPSTYAAILGVATLGFAALRRRKQAQLLA